MENSQFTNFCLKIIHRVAIHFVFVVLFGTKVRRFVDKNMYGSMTYSFNKTRHNMLFKMHGSEEAP